MDLQTLSMSSTRCPHSVQHLIVQIPQVLTLWEAKEWMSRENTWGLERALGTGLSLFQPASEEARLSSRLENRFVRLKLPKA